MKTLISMTDFALEQYKIEQSPYSFWRITGKYAEFLKQPLKLEMFVPEKPEPTFDAYMQPKEMTRQYDEWFDKYGKEVLFKLPEGMKAGILLAKHKTIEDLIPYKFELTENAIKKIKHETN